MDNNIIIPPNNIQYDIVYYVSMHRESEYNLYLIRNITKFNKYNRIIICLHLSESQYKEHEQTGVYNLVNTIVVGHSDKVFFNDTSKIGSILLLEWYIEAYDFLERMDYSYKYCMLVDSSSRFIRQVRLDPSDLIYNIHITKNPYNKLKNKEWNCTCFEAKYDKYCRAFLDFAKKEKMYLVHMFHGGFTFTYDFFKILINYIRNNIISLLYEQATLYSGSGHSYPEFIFSTVTFYLTGRMPTTYGKHTLHNLSVQEVKNLLNEEPKIFLFKRVDDIKSNTAKYIDSLPE